MESELKSKGISIKWMYWTSLIASLLVVWLLLLLMNLQSFFENSNMSSFSGLGSFANQLQSLTTLSALFWISMMLLISSGILAGLKLFKEKHQYDHIWVVFVVSILMIFLGLMSSPFFNLISSVASFNFQSMMSAASQLDQLAQSVTMVKFYCYLGLAYLIYLVVVIIRLKGVKFTSIEESHLWQQADLPKIDWKALKQKPYFKWVIVGVSVFGIVLVSFWGYNTFLAKTPVDLMTGCDAQFTGYDGDGTAEGGCRPDFDSTNSDLSQFVGSVHYELSKKEGLSNGDKIQIKPVYSKETAKALKLDVKDQPVTIKVKGLKKQFKKWTDIQKKDQDKLFALAESTVKEYVDDWYVYDDSDSLDSMDKKEVFFKNEDGEASLAVVYRVQYTQRYEIFDDDTSVVYLYARISHITADSSMKVDEPMLEADSYRTYGWEDSNYQTKEVKEFKEWTMIK